MRSEAKIANINSKKVHEDEILAWEDILQIFSGGSKYPKYVDFPTMKLAL